MFHRVERKEQTNSADILMASDRRRSVTGIRATFFAKSIRHLEQANSGNRRERDRSRGLANHARFSLVTSGEPLLRVALLVRHILTI